jgi:tetratricopeptide (TPR) repeat protein
MQFKRSSFILFLLAGSFTACVHQMKTVTYSGATCTTVAAQLAEGWRALHQAMETPGGCDANGGRRCEVLQAEIARLATDCPNNPEVLMANALLAFRARDLARSQQLLDQLLSLRPDFPEAASLRGRISLEQGNLRFALRFLQEQIQRFGDDPGLRETYASALFLARRWDDARLELGMAQKFGAPGWRVAYGLGLVEESQGHYLEAKARFEEARQGRPGWKPPDSHLRALAASGKIAQ